MKNHFKYTVGPQLSEVKYIVNSIIHGQKLSCRKFS